MSNNLFLLAEIYKRVAHGDRIVTYNRYGKTYVRRYFVPRNPRTEKQRNHRDRFKNAVKEWKNLTEKEKETYKQLAEGMSMSGFNLFMSLKMKET
ncbi:MAG: hypothetical protein QMC80_08785 [Thermoplasmatales archaeon]|nr:hypothetical protein [Thermoplasmatales archaeon]